VISQAAALRLHCLAMHGSLTRARLADRLIGPPAARHPILIISPPKAGTHLLEKALRLMPGVKPTGVHLRPHFVARFAEQRYPVDDLGFDFPRDRPAMRKAMSRIGRGRFCTAHFVYSDTVSALLDEFDYKALLILRDPRDIAVSLVNYLKKQKYHPLHDYFRSLDFDAALNAAIEGLDASVAGRPLPSTAERLRTFVPWLEHPRCCTVKFEQLVGEQGGGTAADQGQAVQRVADHLSLSLDEATRRRVADQLFGGTATFHRGTTRQWRQRYQPQHLQRARETMSDLLITLGYETDATWV